VLIGDVLFSRAYNAAAWLDDPFAARFLSEIVGDILEGEIHQDRVSFDPDLTEHEYRRIIHGKTAALYRAAVVVGAHYGGADAALVERLGVFGQHIGTAFQIVDDRLDVTGDESIVGKSLGTDLAEGKMTLPLILWRDGHAPGHRDDARARIRHAWSCEEGALELSRVLREAGALEAADAVARREVDLALAALDDLPASPDRDLLVAIAGYVVDRTR
jgi:octaprenyl-diphosphate synthase